MSTDLKAIQNVLNLYGEFRESWQADRLADIQALLKQTKPQLAVLRQQAAQWERENAPRYNIFKLLDVEVDEVKTHTPFLRDLLDPHGKHSQGYLFLETFLEMCQNKVDQKGGRFPELPDAIDNGRWKVKKERRLEFEDPNLYGQVDLIISNDEFNILFIIENKIKSPERSNQLYRYSMWMEERNDKYKRQALMYLTPSGKVSTTNNNKLYYRLSYHDDIYKWLVDVLHCKLNSDGNIVLADKVRLLLEQYLEIIKDLEVK